MAQWTYLVCDLLTNVPLAELPLTGVSYSKVLNGSGQLRGSFQVENRRSPRRRVRDPYDATMPCRRCVYVLRDGVPQWGGIIWTSAYDSRTGKVTIGCGDWWSYFDHRKVLPVLSWPIDVEFEVANLVVSQTGVDQNALTRYLVTLAQSHTGGNLGIVFDNPGSTSGIPRDRTWVGYELADVGEELRRLTQVLDGPDLTFDVSPALDANGRPVRLMRQGDPWLGQQGSAWVWELDGNVTSYTWPRDGTRYAKTAYAVGKGMDFGTPIAASRDITRPSWPLMETETGYTSVESPDVLQDHADYDQQVARLPVALPTLTVRGDRSPAIGEWGVGDDGRVLIEDDFVPRGIDTTMRIVRADVTPGEDSVDEVTLTMAPLLDDVA